MRTARTTGLAAQLRRRVGNPASCRAAQAGRTRPGKTFVALVGRHGSAPASRCWSGLCWRCFDTHGVEPPRRLALQGPPLRRRARRGVGETGREPASSAARRPAAAGSRARCPQPIGGSDRSERGRPPPHQVASGAWSDTEKGSQRQAQGSSSVLLAAVEAGALGEAARPAGACWWRPAGAAGKVSMRDTRDRDVVERGQRRLRCRRRSRPGGARSRRWRARAGAAGSRSVPPMRRRRAPGLRRSRRPA